MIRALRRQLTDKGFRIILLISLASFMFAGIVPLLYRRFSKEGQNLIAKINGIEITPTEYIKRVKQEQDRLAFFKQQFGAQADDFLAMLGMTADPEEKAFSDIQREKILDSIAYRMNLEISPDYIMSRLQDEEYLSQQLGSSFVDALGKVDLNKLRAFLRQQGITMAEFEQAIEDQLRRSFVLNFAQVGAHAPEFMVRQRYIKEQIARKYSILLFSRDYYVKEVKKEEVSNDELKNFFDRQNRVAKKYFVPEKRSGFFWIFDPLTYGIEVTDKEIETKYNRNKKNYLVSPETVTVRKVVFPLGDTEDKNAVRAEAEKKLAELKENPQKFPKGDTETFERGKSKDAAISRAAFALKNDGDISEIIESKQEGLVILQRVSQSDVQYKSLAEVSAEIKDGIILDKFKRRFPQDVRRAINEGNVADFIQEKGAPRNKIVDQTKTQDPLQGKVFSLGLEKYGYVFDRGQGYIVQTTEIQKAHVPELEAVKDKVKQDYYNEMADKALKTAMDKTYQDALAAENGYEALKKAASQPGVTFEETDFMAPDDSKTLSELDKKGISASSLLEITVPGNVIKETTPQGGFLAQLDKIAEIDEGKYEQEKPVLYRSVSRQMEGLVQSGFVASLLKNAKIEMYVPIGTAKKKSSV